MPNFRDPRSIPSLMERIIAVANYFTFGMVGFVWLILVALKKAKITPFLQYHIFQTFFTVMLFWLASVFIGLIAQILSFVPFINLLVVKIIYYFNAPFFAGKYSIVSSAISLIVLYLCLTSFQGKYSYLPWISPIIRKNIRG